jgi:hypothetical protein
MPAKVSKGNLIDWSVKRHKNVLPYQNPRSKLKIKILYTRNFPSLGVPLTELSATLSFAQFA